MRNYQYNILSELIIDNFAGGGGASTGLDLAFGRPVDIAINHDPDAIAMHRANHPFSKHYCESVWDIDPIKATQGRPVALCWFSPDCKHFSKAKGGKPVEKHIRGLAWVVLRWAAKVKPRVIMLENVEEFKTWGPVRNGRPVKSRVGETFNRWKNQLEALGYEVEMRGLRACDYGAPTIRKRFFVIARRDGQPIVWPELTHGDPKSEAVHSGQLKPWRTAAEIIDWSLPCPSIFDTAEEIYEKYGVRAVRPLAENTMRRIARGIQKFVIDNPEPFIVSIGQNGFCGDRSRSIHDPLNTTVSKAEQCVITPVLTKYHGQKSENEARGQLPDEPIKTIDTANRYAMAAATLIQTGYGEAPGQQPRVPGLDKPLGTVVSGAKHAAVAAHITKFQQNSHGQVPNAPMDTVMPGAQRFGVTVSHVVKMKGTNIGQNTDAPLQTITASGNHFGEVRAFLIKYYGQGLGQDVAEPLHTATSRDTFGLVTIRGAQYAIVDIGLRMLTPRELYNANGFPPDYIIDRDDTGKPYPKSKQVARCGNAVPPPFAEALARANLPEFAAGRAMESMKDLMEYMTV